MNRKRIAVRVVLSSIVGLASYGVQVLLPAVFYPSVALAGGGGHGHEHESAHEPEPEKGPHGGRLLVDGELAIEVTIFERGVPPQYRVYAYEGNRALDPSDVDLTIELARLGGRTDKFRFKKENDYLVGDGVVEEPHSFDVTVVAARGGETHRWTYPSYEGRVELGAEAIESSELVIETAGPATIKSTVPVYGRVTPDGDRLVRVVPRFPGVVKDVRKRLGDTVSVGEVLAVVESNESLQAYEVRSAIAGTVIQKDVTPGTFAREGEVIFTVADMSRVWIDFYVPPQDASRVALGQVVTIDQKEREASAKAVIGYLSPIQSEAAQTTLARVELPNPDGEWRPGAFVSGEITVEEVTVPLAVRVSALQTFRDWDVVFMNEGNVFEVRPLELGRRDAEWIEVLSGFATGQRYAADNSFILKADVGKSGASHDH